jgi:ABC-type multidrug transport system fused ATPase/permease subunit
MDVEK